MNYKKYFTIELAKKVGRLLYDEVFRNLIKEFVDNPKADWDEKFLDSLDKLIDKVTELKPAEDK